MNKNLSEWIETDGLGGFASGTVCGQRTRRYHALLLFAKNPPADRVVLVNGFDAWFESEHGTSPLTTQLYDGEDGDAEWPNGHEFLQSFASEPWPTWSYGFRDHVTVVQELFVPEGVPGVALRWRVEGNPQVGRLHVKPFLSGRGFHSMHHRNDDLSSASTVVGDEITWQTYTDSTTVHARTNAEFVGQAEWFERFLYVDERSRGLDATEDLFSPGELHFDLTGDDGYLLLSAGDSFEALAKSGTRNLKDLYEEVASRESSRRKTLGREQHIADSYIVRRGKGKTIIAGYPWFGDWGRDTFIAMRGLCFTHPAGFETGRDILLQWSTAVSEGMLPNRFPDQGDSPEFNSVDASLWYIIAVQDYLSKAESVGHQVDQATAERLNAAVANIINGFIAGTRYGIRVDSDGLVAAGEPGVQLTWMDAKVDDWVVTPRIGKPVEIQALWLNALYAASYSDQWNDLLGKGTKSFRERFWNEEAGHLNDVVDANHEAGTVDSTFRPNQIFAAGGLPLSLVSDEQAARVVEQVEARLLTPIGLRSLDADHPDYRAHYGGGVWERDGSYHQGTVWPWLMGPFVEAWLRVRGNSHEAKKEANDRFVGPLERHIETTGLGHISEICDAEEPFTPRGCPFQAWSYGEYLRIKRQLLNR